MPQQEAGVAGDPGPPKPSAVHDEDVLATRCRQRTPVEVAVQRVDGESRDVDETEPLVLRRPPQRAPAAVVAHDVDAIVRDVVVEAMRNPRLDPLPVVPGGDVMVERECIPCESAARTE